MKRSSFEAEGLIYFNDLFDANGTLYGYENFVNSFAVNINFVDFYSLMHSIPRNYRTLDKIEIPHDYCCDPLGVILKHQRCVKIHTKLWFLNWIFKECILRNGILHLERLYPFLIGNTITPLFLNVQLIQK